MPKKLNKKRSSLSQPQVPICGQTDLQFEANQKTSLATLVENASEHILQQMPLDFWATNASGEQLIFQSNTSIENWGDFQGLDIARLSFPAEMIAVLQDCIDTALTGRVVEYEMNFPITTIQKQVYHNQVHPIQDENQKVIGVIGFCQNVTEQKEKEKLLIARRKLAERLNKVSGFEESLQLCFDIALRISRIQIATIMIVDKEGIGHILAYSGMDHRLLESIDHIKIDQPIRDAAARGDYLVRNSSQFHNRVGPIMDKQNTSELAQFPICYEGEVVALLNVALRKPERFPKWCIDELKTIVSQAETAIVRIKTQEKLESDRRLLRQLFNLQEQERHLVSSEIHDGFVQDVVGAQMVLETLVQTCSDHDIRCPEFFNQANQMLGNAIAAARRFISDLRPLIIEEAGITEAVKFLINRFTPPVQEKICYTYDESIDRFNPIIEGVAFRIIQEGLTNAILHSKATEIDIHLDKNEELLLINIIDNGVGFEPQEVMGNGFGVSGIVEKASIFGGEAKIESEAGKGTKVQVILPIIRVDDSTFSDELPSTQW